MAPSAPSHPADVPRKLIVQAVRKVFHAKGDGPVVPAANALFPPGAIIRRVHADIASMMIGGVSALLLQMLDPAALAGVWDHSAFREDMMGRLRRTARFIAVTTFAEQDEALAAIARVKAIHARVQGRLRGGEAYRADAPDLLAWVHACQAQSFLGAWLRFGDPAMPLVDKNAYIAQSGRVAALLGADPVPQTRAQLAGFIETKRPALRADARTHEARRLVLDPPDLNLAARPLHRLLTHAALGLLPDWAREMHGLPWRPMEDFEGKLGATAVAKTLRWAFAQSQG